MRWHVLGRASYDGMGPPSGTGIAMILFGFKIERGDFSFIQISLM